MSAVVTQTTRLSPFSVFRNPNFTKIWTGQLISTMGSALTSLAASIYIFRLTGSALSVGLMLMATALPSLLVGLFAGVLVDRYDRKRIMFICDLLRAGLVVLIPLLAPHGIAWLYVIVMLTSAIGQFFDPAQESVLPELASDEELAAANSLMAISSFGATAIGFAASGLIAASANISWAFYLDAVSFIISAAFILMIRIQPLQAEGETSINAVLKNLKVGVQHLFETPILRSLFLTSIPTLIAFGLSNALLLPFALRALKATEFEYGLQEGLTSLAFVVGSLLMASVFDRLREGAWIALGFIGMAVTSMVYASLHSIPLAILVVGFSGFFNAPSAIGRRTAVQRNTPRELRGRVNSAFFVSRDILFLIGMASAGLADFFNVRWMFFFSGVLLLAGGLLVLVLPGLRQNRQEWQQALHLLRAAPKVPGLGLGRLPTPADLDLLVGLLPTFKTLSAQERDSLITEGHVLEAPSGTTILHHGEGSDEAFFILSGRAVAGISTTEGEYRSLSSMEAGDFFGEISALTGSARTADVVAAENIRLLQVPAQTLRDLMNNPALSALVNAKMTERTGRTSLRELPRFVGLDQQDAVDLRTEPSVD